jgi:hypothetical protein
VKKEEPIGEAAEYPKMPAGLCINPKTNEPNTEFRGIEKDGRLLFVRSSDSTKYVKPDNHWKELRHFDADFHELLEFAGISSRTDIRSYAEAHGPLFGEMYIDGDGGIIREPEEMWLMASSLMNLALRLKAAYDQKNWLSLQASGLSFEAEIKGPSDQQRRDAEERKKVNVRGKRPVRFTAVAKIVGLPKDYKDLVLDGEEAEKGYWMAELWDPPALVRKRFDVDSLPDHDVLGEVKEERRGILKEESVSSLSASILMNDSGENLMASPALASIRFPLENVDGPAFDWGQALCRLMSEALISLHCRRVEFTWVGHKFWPVFPERIRYLWFLYHTHYAHEILDSCAYCGAPFVKTRADRKYCSDKCRKNANR